MMEKKKRYNTYTNKDYFKIIALASNKDKAYKFAKFLTEDSNPQRGVFYYPFLKTQLIVFPRYISKLDHQATTVAVEALVIYLENEEEFYNIKDVLYRYKQVPIKLIVSDLDCKHLLDHLGENSFFVNISVGALEIKNIINNLDKEEFKKIKSYFEIYDEDKGGTIDQNEMSLIAKQMGQDTNNDEFKKGIMALDLNRDNQISLSEFIMWWKIGRQNIYALPKIYDLYAGVQKLLHHENFNYKSYFDRIEYIEVKENDDNINFDTNEKKYKDNNKSSQRILFKSPGVYKIQSKIEISLAFGASKRYDMAVRFLSQFTKNTGSAKANWISILVPLNQRYRKLDTEKAKFMLDEFKEKCISWGEKHMGIAFTSFAKNLLVFETTSNEYSVALGIRLKIDIEELVKRALKDLVNIILNIQSKDDSTWLKFKINSNIDLMDAINKNITLKDFLDVSEFILESVTCKDRLKNLYLSFNQKLQNDLSFLKLFFESDILDLELDCNLSSFVSYDKNIKNSFFNMNLNKIGLFLDFLKNGLTTELLSCAENVEICISAFNIFASLKIFSNKTFNKH